MAEPADKPDAAAPATQVLRESYLSANVPGRETDIDSLGFEPYVTALAAFLTSPETKGPLTVSIEGEWGSGKSSFLLQLESALRKVAVFVGKYGSGASQPREVQRIWERSLVAGWRVIPVILPGVEGDPDLPDFLRQLRWVDFRVSEPDPLEDLVRGIQRGLGKAAA